MYPENFIKIMEKSSNFTEFMNSMNDVGDNVTLGKYFEYFAKVIFLHDERFQYVKDCWLLDELPEKYHEKLCIPTQDIGIDIVLKTNDNDYIAVQVKYRKNTSTPIKWDALSTFFGLTFGLSGKFSKGMLFTNTKEPNKHIIGKDNVILVMYKTLNEITQQTFDGIKSSFMKEHPPEIKLIIQRRAYQEEIVNKTQEHFKTHNRGCVFCPCGTGKTLISFWIAEQMKDNKYVCVVVPSLYILSQVYNTWSGQKRTNYLLIGSDAELKLCYDTGLLLTTKKHDIKKYFNKHKDEQITIITTYQSSKLINSVCKKQNISIDLCIFDEAHRTVGNKDRDYVSLMCYGSCEIRKRLFMTATEKIYIGGNEDVMSMDNTDIYGDTIYNYTFKNAIDAGYLCDYNIIVPLITNKIYKKAMKRNKYIIDNNIDENIESRYYLMAYLIMTSIKTHNVKHILTFSHTNESAYKLYKLLEAMSKAMNVKNNCYHLTGDDPMKKRHRIINDFIKDDISIISSAKIFSEGVDIPIVDCVCFADNKVSKIDIIQSIGRALRKHESKTVGYVIIPTVCDIRDDILDDTTDFGNVKTIIKSIGTVDERIVEEFAVKLCGRNYDNSRVIVNTNTLEKYSNLQLDIEQIKSTVEPIICNKWGKVSWLSNYKRVEKWIARHNKLPHEKKPADESTEHHLGCWCNGNRSDYHFNKLDKEKIEYLEKLQGWYWKIEDQLDEQYKLMYNKLVKYVEENDKMPVEDKKHPTSEQHKLAVWCLCRRRDKRENKLSDDKIEQLEKITHWYWDKKDPFHENRELYIKWISEHERAPKTRSTDPMERRMYIWSSRLKRAKHSGNVSDDKIQLMNEIDEWVW